ncbi:putative glycerol kinase 5, partial [Varanus komodoensis]
LFGSRRTERLTGKALERFPASAAMTPAEEPGKYILGIDIGSTVIRCHVYDKSAVLKASSASQVEILYPQLGWVEMDPENLWTQFVSVVKNAVKGKQAAKQ